VLLAAGRPAGTLVSRGHASGTAHGLDPKQRHPARTHDRPRPLSPWGRLCSRQAIRSAKGEAALRHPRGVPCALLALGPAPVSGCYTQAGFGAQYTWLAPAIEAPRQVNRSAERENVVDELRRPLRAA
jgi:hypothetical protein